MRKTWWHLESWNDFGKERQKERKRERKRETFRKKKGKKFFESLSLSREKKHLLHTFVLYNDLVFSFFFPEDLRDDFDDTGKKRRKKDTSSGLAFLCFVIL